MAENRDAGKAMLAGLTVTFLALNQNEARFADARVRGRCRSPSTARR